MRFLLMRSGLWIGVTRQSSFIKSTFVKIIRVIFLISGCATAILLVEMLGAQFACIHFKPPLRIGGGARLVLVRTHCLG